MLLLLVLLTAVVRAEKCSQRSVTKFPLVFKDCETYYDECECLQRKLVYLKDKQCEGHELYAAVEAALAEKACAARELQGCLYKNDYECRIVHSGCLDVASMHLGGTITHCLEKFVACLDKAECTTLPLYLRAKEILANPESFHDQLNPPAPEQKEEL